MKTARKLLALLLTAALLAVPTAGVLADEYVLPAFNPEIGAGKLEQPSIPLLLLVIGFDGGGESKYEMNYDSRYDWSSIVFKDEGAVSKYYSDMSNNTFTFVPVPETSAYGTDGNTNISDKANDGVVHVTLHQPHPILMTAEDEESDPEFDTLLAALDAASKYVDFRSLDLNRNGVLDKTELATNFIFAGFSSTDPVISYCDVEAFPHLWAYQGTPANMTVAGLQIPLYVATPEIEMYPVPETPVTYVDADGTSHQVRYSEFESKLNDFIDAYGEEAELDFWLTNISFDCFVPNGTGTLCHELGHFLGLSDYYDVNYMEPTDPEAIWYGFTPDSLSVMDGGANTMADGKSCPTAMDAYSLSWLGWETPVRVTESGVYTLHSKLSSAGYNTLRIDTPNPGEYYLLENRQPEGRDKAFATAYEYDPLGGIVLWHIDENVIREYYDANEVNVPNHRSGVTPEYPTMEYGENEDEVWYAGDLTLGSPSMEIPFYARTTAEERFPDTRGVVELPMYGAGDRADDLTARTGTGIRLTFLSDSGRDMQVHIALAGDPAYDPAAETPVTPEVPETPVTPENPTPGLPFSDVSADHWAAEAILAMHEAGILKGNLDGTFNPSGNVNRAMAAQMLFNLAKGTLIHADFSDVSVNDWFSNAVGWAAAEGYIRGAGGAFRPLENITRQDFLTILYRYASGLTYYDPDLVGQDTNTLDYSDIFTVADYATPAFHWGLAAGLINGYEDGSVRPAGTLTRAEAAVILLRFLNEIS